MSADRRRETTIRLQAGQYMKIRAAASYLGISSNTLRKYTDLGLIQAKRLPSGDRLYRKDWLEQFVEDLPEAGRDRSGVAKRWTL